MIYVEGLALGDIRVIHELIAKLRRNDIYYLRRSVEG